MNKDRKDVIDKTETRVIDIHSHIFPGVDDGADNFEITKQMIRMDYEDVERILYGNADERLI